MKVIPPITVTDALLVSSTAAEPGPGETAWVSGTTYAVGDVRIRAATHRKYERLTAGAGTTPPESDLVNWFDVGPTNKWAMFDLYRNTATQIASPLTVAITPGQRINAFGIVGLNANQVRVQLTVGATSYYDRTLTTLLRNTTTWTDYVYGDFRYQNAAVLFDLPPVAGATLTITITGGAVACGGIVFGKAVYMGKVLADAENDGLNFSKIERDTVGTSILVPRRTVPKTDQQLVIDSSQVPSMLQLRSDLNAVPALYSGLDDKTGNDYFTALLIMGIYKQFRIPLKHPNTTVMNVTLEEI